MKIKILGTAAAEGWPGIFCECSVCQKARKLGGKNIRTRSSILIGEEHKIDFPPDTYLHLVKYNISFSRIKYLFITHAHYDHYNPSDLLMRKFPPFTRTPLPSLKIYGNSLAQRWTFDLLKIMERNFEKNFPLYNFEFQLVEPFKEFRAGNLRILPLLANHDKSQICYNYLFSTSHWSFLQAFDTGWYPEETWEKLKEIASQKAFDLVIMDCTNGKIETGKKGGHLGIKEIIEMKKKLTSQGNIKNNSRFIATHFSHGGGLLHQELEKILLPEGIEVAFDGMEINLPER